MASSCSRTGTRCWPMAGRSRLPRRQCARGWRSCQGRHDEDGGRWVTQGRRGKTGPLCAGCSGKSSPASPQRSKPWCSNGLRGTCHASRPGNRQPGMGATRGSAAMAADRRRGIAGVTANSPTCRMAQGQTGGPEDGITADQSVPRGHRAHCLGGGLDPESVKWPRVLAGPGPRRKAARRKPRAALAADGHRP